MPIFRRDTSNLDVLRLNFIFVKFSVLSNFQCARKFYFPQILTPVKFSGSCKSAAKSNFHSSCSWELLSNFKKLDSCARPSNFKNFLVLSWKKVENFFNLYYNKRGNININIFYITIFYEFQIFSAHMEKGSLSTPFIFPIQLSSGLVTLSRNHAGCPCPSLSRQPC